jgi:hypothetical protein
MSERSTRSLCMRAGALAAGLLAACGGAPDAGDARPVQARAQAPLHEQAQVQVQAQAQAQAIVPPLMADDGSLYASQPQAVPADAGAWTRQARYATTAQAEQLERSLGDAALAVEVGCCGVDAVERAVGTVWGLQAARDLPMDAPVLLRGSNLRLVAAAANRVADGGMSRVWLVAP